MPRRPRTTQKSLRRSAAMTRPSRIRLMLKSKRRRPRVSRPSRKQRLMLKLPITKPRRWLLRQTQKQPRSRTRPQQMLPRPRKRLPVPKVMPRSQPLKVKPQQRKQSWMELRLRKRPAREPQQLP